VDSKQAAAISFTGGIAAIALAWVLLRIVPTTIARAPLLCLAAMGVALLILSVIAIAKPAWFQRRQPETQDAIASPTVTSIEPDFTRRSAVDEIYLRFGEAEKLCLRLRRMAESFREPLASGKKDQYAAQIDELLIQLEEWAKEIGKICERYEHVRAIGEYLRGDLGKLAPLLTELSNVRGDIQSLTSEDIARGIGSLSQALNQFDAWIRNSKEIFRTMR